MKKFCCAAAMAAVLSGCAPAPTKSLNTGSVLQGKQVVVSHYATPDFSAMTAGKAALGVFGAMSMISSGNELVKTENIPDPALEIGAQLAGHMAETQSVTLLSTPQPIAKNDSPATLVKTYSGADLIMDVKTLYWAYGYYPMTWNKYRVFYTARVRLIDGKTGALVAQHQCRIEPDDPDHAPTLEALRADRAALLKASLHKAAETCINDVEQKALRV